MRLPKIVSTRKSRRITALGITALGLGLVLSGTGTTGAFFSETRNGGVTGTVGSIHVVTAGGTGQDGLNFAFNNLLPGESQTASATFTNNGSSTEDVWLVFPNATALSALNTLGTYGEVHIKSNGQPVFDSANLNDRSATCGPFAPDGCWPLMGKYKLASGVNPGDTGSVQLSFNYAAKLKTQSAPGTTAAFNPYPINGQTTVNQADGNGNGLPFQIVAVQQGQTP